MPTIRTHKTFSGMRRAAERLTAELLATAIDNDRDYRSYLKRVDALNAELGALWSNPADVSECAKLKAALSDAWNRNAS